MEKVHGTLYLADETETAGDATLAGEAYANHLARNMTSSELLLRVFDFGNAVVYTNVEGSFRAAQRTIFL